MSLTAPKCRLCEAIHWPRVPCKFPTDIRPLDPALLRELAQAQEHPRMTVTFDAQAQIALLVTRVTDLENQVKALQLLRVTPSEGTMLQCNGVTKKSRAEYMKKRREAQKNG